jgi:hypothetical protein
MKQINQSNCNEIVLSLWKRLSRLPDNKQNKRAVLKKMGYINIINDCPLCESYPDCINLEKESCIIFNCADTLYPLWAEDKTQANAKRFYEELKQIIKMKGGD